MNLRVQKYAEITLHFESSFLMLTTAQWMVWQPPPQCTVLKHRGVLANSGGRDQNMATDFMFLGLPPYPTSGSATRKCVHTADRRLTDHWDAHGTFFIQLHGFFRGTLETIYCWHPLWSILDPPLCATTTAVSSRLTTEVDTSFVYLGIFERGYSPLIEHRKEGLKDENLWSAEPHGETLPFQCEIWEDNQEFRNDPCNYGL